MAEFNGLDNNFEGPIMVEGRSFMADLICLPLAHLDVILGMDWLSTNHIFLDCKEKMLVFGGDLHRGVYG